MELWVKSQEGTLGKVLFIRPAGLSLDVHFEGNYTTSEHFKTEQRALEVLDEIQEYINNNCEFIEQKTHTKMGTYTNKIETKVYEMPEE